MPASAAACALTAAAGGLLCYGASFFLPTLAVAGAAAVAGAIGGAVSSSPWRDIGGLPPAQGALAGALTTGALALASSAGGLAGVLGSTLLAGLAGGAAAISNPPERENP